MARPAASETDRAAPGVGQPVRLRRGLGLVLVVLYGLGTTIGAGIYALIGEIAGIAGAFAPVSFVLAALLATPTALSFAELSARFPRSAGEALYVREGLGRGWLALTVGLLVVLTGIVAAAAVSAAFVGYFAALSGSAASGSVVFLVLALAAVAVWGIKQSVLVAGVLTLVEVGGLLLAIWAGWAGPDVTPLPPEAPSALASARVWLNILSGTALAFFAFLGFEDMVNIAEEVRDARRTLPAAIVATLIITAVLYAAVAFVAIRTVAPAELAASDAPLALILSRAGYDPRVMAAIGVVAIVNGALILMIMASRVLYGLSVQGDLPAFLSRVHPRTRTPIHATVLVAAVILVLALAFPLAELARAATLCILVVFILVNLALWRLKKSGPLPSVPIVIPVWIPAAGAIVSTLLAGFEIVELLLR